MSSTMALLERASIPLGKGLLGPPYVQLPKLHSGHCGKATILRGSITQPFGEGPNAAVADHRREPTANLAFAFSVLLSGPDRQSKKQKRARGQKQVCHARANEHPSLGSLQHWARRRRATPLQPRSEVEEWGWGSGSDRLDTASHVTLATGTPTPSLPFASARPRIFEEVPASARQMKMNCVPPLRDIPPQRDTGIASEQEWSIDLVNVKWGRETGINEDGSTWWKESGEDLGENGFRSRWTVMGGRNKDGTSEWKETWWEKSDWTGYRELGAEKSGRNAPGDSWWETWQEVFRQDEWSGLTRIEKSAHKQAKSKSGGVWNEKWWEKYNAKGWTEKGAHKYGKLNDQAWWEKWGEQYDGRGAVVKWTDKWAESSMGTRWGDKWEERFDRGKGMRNGETWHVKENGERWNRTWGERHDGSGLVQKFGRSSSGESWDIEQEENTYYDAQPHYGWAEAVANSLQLLAIEIRPKPPAGPPSAPGEPSSSGAPSAASDESGLTSESGVTSSEGAESVSSQGSQGSSETPTSSNAPPSTEPPPPPGT
ncbi:hypothetical protein KFL_000450180 [Klebsormidium nitens]|uniref:Uncharacterized protein n=1 Tax=Klebsormidium nitens TaxID=105231 RepID=A0A1Y1HQJ3_KLENI|nr:hypothetical protein KFL_000450180 [Klebsormidium nitens]|eukprot:GAQ80062.1 hypothetical protein KFL_000450180 [Klebsormidium nitens]